MALRADRVHRENNRMTAKLNIPLTQPSTTRRRSWRVVWMVCIQILLLITVWFAAAAIFRAQASTLTLAPENTQTSLLVIKNKKTIASISENIGNEQLFSSAPWTIQDAMSWSKREFSLHFHNGTLVGITIDQPLDKNTLALAEFLEFYTSNDHGNYGISTVASQERAISTFHAALLHPQTNAVFLENNNKYRTRINETSITIKGIGQNSPNFPSWNLSEGTEVLSRWYIPPGTATLHGPLSNLIQKEGAHTLFAKDSLGLAHFITISDSDLTTEALADLGNSLISQYALTTTAWTTNDGSTFEEIRVDTNAIETEIESQDGLTSITSRVGNDVVRITKSSELITISNRELSSNPVPSQTSNCLPGADNYANLRELARTLNSPGIITPHTVSTPVTSTWFNEIAVNNRILRLCW